MRPLLGRDAAAPTTRRSLPSLYNSLTELIQRGCHDNELNTDNKCFDRQILVRLYDTDAQVFAGQNIHGQILLMFYIKTEHKIIS